jgi:hypothetical protein
MVNEKIFDISHPCMLNLCAFDHIHPLDAKHRISRVTNLGLPEVHSKGSR